MAHSTSCLDFHCHTMNKPDHRSRVAADKREKMRMLLIECAIPVLSQKGVEAAVIEDVIKLADVSRGSFYNHFKTNEELLGAVLQELGNELFALIEQTLGQRKDSVERIGLAVRLMLQTTAKYPHLARFMSQAGADLTGPNSFLMAYLKRDIAAGVAAGKLDVPDPLIGIDIVVGLGRVATQAIGSRAGLDANYPQEIAYRMLVALGLAKASARRIAALRLPAFEYPADSLFVRSGLRAARENQ